MLNKLGVLLLLKNVGSARVRKSDINPIGSKTPAPQYQPIDRKKRERRIEDYSRDRAAKANKNALAQLLKPTSPTPSNTGLEKSFQRDTVRPVWIFFLLSDVHFDIFPRRNGPSVTVRQSFEFVPCPINFCGVLNECNLNGICCAPCE